MHAINREEAGYGMAAALRVGRTPPLSSPTLPPACCLSRPSNSPVHQENTYLPIVTRASTSLLFILVHHLTHPCRPLTRDSKPIRPSELCHRLARKTTLHGTKAAPQCWGSGSNSNESMNTTVTL
ncbi:hypothetical protein Pcinc_044509 [Petrolisthes cinctipes]|uniref:Uncharacterized protein n=1 Tax=Petrolisthes cinctipes TaxID=88211 RepID=A0AAE1ETL6_PETCI|nr:hypothetical protein Pcinc_044509 [Petrolisthes cinctipes]